MTINRRSNGDIAKKQWGYNKIHAEPRPAAGCCSSTFFGLCSKTTKRESNTHPKNRLISCQQLARGRPRILSCFTKLPRSLCGVAPSPAPTPDGFRFQCSISSQQCAGGYTPGLLLRVGTIRRELSGQVSGEVLYCVDPRNPNPTA